MSAMDQVFIKAYGKGAIAHSIGRGTHAAAPSPTLQSRIDPGAVVPAANNVADEKRLDPPWSDQRSGVSTPATFGPASSSAATLPLPTAPLGVVPAPHIRFTKPLPPAEASAFQVSMTEEPVSSTTPETLPADSSPLEAAFEVVRFGWPELVDRMTTAASGGFNALATLVSQRAVEGRKVIAIASAQRGEGRSTVALAVARLIGRRNVRVALVDADFNRPQLGELLQLAVQVGWEDVLAGDQPLSEALIESIADRVTLLPLRWQVPEPIHDPRHGIAEAIETLRRWYDLVVIDVGPLTSDAAAIELAAMFHGARIDDALVVCDVGRTPPEEIQLVGRRLSAAGVEHWDMVENFVQK